MVIWRSIVLHILSVHAVTSNIINILERVLNVSLLNETPKQWQKYVNNVIFKTVYVCSDKTGNTLTITSSMKILLEKSKSFISYSTKFCNEETMTMDENYTAIVAHQRNFADEIYGKAIVSSANISRASGHFSIVAPHLRKFDYQLKYLWIFQLFKKLRITVTFHFIYFHGSSNNCQLGYVEVKPIENRSENNFLFCGQLSKFLIFPTYRNIVIKVKTNEQIFFRQLFTYQVIDWKILSSYSSSNNISHIPEIIFSKQSTTLQTFSIKVNHYEGILLAFSTDIQWIIFLHNGPGLASPLKIIRKKKKKIS